MLISMALFAVEDMFLKLASAGLPTGEIIFVAGFFGAPVFAVMAREQGARILTARALHPAVHAADANLPYPLGRDGGHLWL